MYAGRPRNDVSSSRRSIPRPWLEQQAKARQQNNYELQYTGLDLLEKPNHGVSWDKLMNCFCLRDQEDESKKKQQHRSEDPAAAVPRQTTGPFPGIPHFRRHSSSGSIYDGIENYAHDSFMSDFTSSDSNSSTSSYSSSSSDSQSHGVYSNSAASNNISIQQRPSWTSNYSSSTPPPPPGGGAVSNGKPPIAKRGSSLSRTGLPPRQQNSPIIQSPPVQSKAGGGGSTRKRFDTADYSRQSFTSNTSNTSRHRRSSQQFSFTANSMEQIWAGSEQESGLPPPPPSFVLCKEGGPRISQPPIEDSGYISPLEDDDEDDHEEDRNASSTTDRIVSPPRVKSSLHDYNNIPPPIPHVPIKTSDDFGAMEKPEYLRKNKAYDDDIQGNVILSGWVAASFGSNDDQSVVETVSPASSSLEDRLISGTKLRLKDLCYMQIIDLGDVDRTALIRMQDSKGEEVLSLCPEWGWSCQSKEITGRVGKAVSIYNRSRKLLATILPVSLGDCFFEKNGQELVSSKDFQRLHNELFVKGSGKVYAPDEQLDAAMFIMFSLDALFKQCSNKRR